MCNYAIVCNTETFPRVFALSFEDCLTEDKELQCDCSCFLRKMDQRRSKDSLRNDNEECRYSSASSTPTDFTSDDESYTSNNLFILNTKSIADRNSKQKNVSLGVGSQQRKFSHVLPYNVNEQWPTDDYMIGGSIDDRNWWDSKSNLMDKLLLDACDESKIRLIEGDTWNVPNEVDGNSLYRSDREMEQSRHHRDIDDAMPIQNTRSINVSLAERLCSQIYERCRSLEEVVEFVETNRNLIEAQTDIILEAPAYRNYDMSNYQIDYSVKESFNPNFWVDREPVVTTADGNCQYHAVSISLTGTESHTPAVRLVAAVAVIDNRNWFESMLKLTDRGSVLELVRTISRSYSWGDETTLKAVAIGIKRKIYLYSCNTGKKDYEMVMSLSKEELLDAFRNRKYRGGTGIHTYADPLSTVPSNNYIMLFHKSEHFIAVLPTTHQVTNYEPYNPIVPAFV